MAVFQQTLHVGSPGQGMHEITRKLQVVLKQSGLSSGVLTVFCRHTSCSLVIMENADPSARHDLAAWLERLVPTNDPHFTHTYEGPDDMPSHIKMALTRTSETIPFAEGELQLGTWQGVYLWEHRHSAHSRQLVITVIGE
jgi:secondary thiamine-phosphate synthase enzyme